ncbi:MAG: hypothetical protein U5R49_22685 [Deltaproteobacteria bacterium]|nr:hypothetical protein [Deltaproteobacteria bacterium]
MEEDVKKDVTDKTPDKAAELTLAETGDVQTEAAETPPKKAPSFAKPLDKMTVPELKDVAMEIPGVTGVSAMKKDELLALIKGYWEIEDEDEKEKKRVKKPVADIKQLKKRILDLRGQGSRQGSKR